MKSHYHCVYKLTYHLVLVTKYRKKCLSNEMLNRLEEIVKKNCADWEIDLLEFNGEADHIHLLLIKFIAYYNARLSNCYIVN